MTHCGAQNAGRIKHAARIPDGQGFFEIRIDQLLGLQHFAYRLRDAEIASRQQNHEPITWTLVNNALAKHADLVKARIGSRVRQKNHALFEFDGNAVSHDEVAFFLSW